MITPADMAAQERAAILRFLRAEEAHSASIASNPSHPFAEQHRGIAARLNGLCRDIEAGAHMSAASQNRQSR